MLRQARLLSWVQLQVSSPSLAISISYKCDIVTSMECRVHMVSIAELHLNNYHLPNHWIHSAVDMCEQRHAPTVWLTCSEVDLKWIASLWRYKIKLIHQDFWWSPVTRYNSDVSVDLGYLLPCASTKNNTVFWAAALQTPLMHLLLILLVQISASTENIFLFSLHLIWIYISRLLSVEHYLLIYMYTHQLCWT
jgi:hypothetical protein